LAFEQSFHLDEGVSVLNRVTTTILGSVLATVLATTCRAQQEPNPQALVDPNRVVVVINGEEIKGLEYYRRMEYLSGVGTQMGATFSEFPPGFLTIQQLITERLVFQLAKDKGIYPTDEEVQEELTIRQKDNPTLLKDWIGSGGNSEELKYQLRYQIAQFKLQTFGITITDTEVDNDYKNRPDVYKIPKQYKLRVIVVSNSDDTKTVDSDLLAGKSFADEAKDKSVDITKNIGGEFGTIPVYKLATETQDALSSIKIGQTTKWLTTNPGGGNGAYLKFLLEDVIPEKKMELDERLRRMIRRKLMADKGKIKNASMPKELDAVRLKAKIDIKQSEFADAYDKLLKTYLKQKGGSN
jgi:foldase protein PrsA